MTPTAASSALTSVSSPCSRTARTSATSILISSLPLSPTVFLIGGWTSTTVSSPFITSSTGTVKSGTPRMRTRTTRRTRSRQHTHAHTRQAANRPPFSFSTNRTPVRLWPNELWRLCGDFFKRLTNMSEHASGTNRTLVRLWPKILA